MCNFSFDFWKKKAYREHIAAFRSLLEFPVPKAILYLYREKFTEFQ